MNEEIRLPRKGEILGIGLIRHSSMTGPLMYFCFDGEVRYVRKTHGFRCAILPVFENELVLINTHDDTLVHKYSVDEIKMLTEKRLLMDLPGIMGLSEFKRKNMFDKNTLNKSAKTKVDLMGIFLNSKLGFDVFISRIGKNERIPARIRMDNFLSMYEDLSGKHMWLESMFANEKTDLKNDYFATLLDLDEKLNKKGYKIICNGTSRDVWPIGGSQRDFYKGLIGFRWMKNKQEVVNIFEVDDWAKYCTTKEHTDIFHKKFKIGQDNKIRLPGENEILGVATETGRTCSRVPLYCSDGIKRHPPYYKRGTPLPFVKGDIYLVKISPADPQGGVWITRYRGEKLEQLKKHGFAEQIMALWDKLVEIERQKLPNNELIAVRDILKGFFKGNEFKLDQDKLSEAVKLMKVIYKALPEDSKLMAGCTTEEIHSRFSAVFKLIKEENIKLKKTDELWQLLEDAFLFMEKLEIVKELVAHGYGPDSTKRAFNSICYLMDLLKSRTPVEEFRKKFNNIQHNIKSSNKEKSEFILLQAVRWVK